MSLIHLGNVNNNLSGFECITRVLDQAHAISGDKVTLEMNGTWFSASMSPALYVVLKRVQALNKSLFIAKNRNPLVDQILTKNGFFPRVTGAQPVEDTHRTTVPFRTFQQSDAEIFVEYLKAHVTYHRSFPNVTVPLRTSIENELTELFTNAIIHSQENLKLITAGGQFFPNRHNLEFCLADAGVGIPHNVRRLEPGISDEDAIFWATQEGKTTLRKKDKISGGLGLTKLKEFINQNGGQLMLVSGHGCYEMLNGRESTKRLTCPFPGTVGFLSIKTEELC